MNVKNYHIVEALSIEIRSDIIFALKKRKIESGREGKQILTFSRRKQRMHNMTFLMTDLLEISGVKYLLVREIRAVDEIKEISRSYLLKRSRTPLLDTVVE